MQHWSEGHQTFAVETVFKNNDSATVTQRVFWWHFDTRRNGKVPMGQTILNWVTQFRTTASIVNRKPPGCPRTVRTPENVRRVAHAFQCSPQRSARRHSLALHLTPRTVRPILHEDLKFHPFKIQLVQQLLPRDLNQRSECCRKLLQMMQRMPQTCKDVPYLQWSSPEWYYLQKVTWKRNAFPCCLPLFS